MSKLLSKNIKKQKKKVLKIVEKLFKYDLEEILVHFKEPKSGTKQRLKERLIFLIETKDENSFIELRKKIRKVYRKNDKIKKTPKKSVESHQNEQNLQKAIVSYDNRHENSVLSQSKELTQINSNNSEPQLSSKRNDNPILSWINCSQQQPQQTQQSSHELTQQLAQQLSQTNAKSVNVVHPYSSITDHRYFNTFEPNNNQFIDFNGFSRNAFSVLNNSSSQIPSEYIPNANQPLFTPIVNHSQQSFTNYRTEQPLNQSVYGSSIVSNSSVHNSKFFPQSYSLNSTSNGFVNSSQTLESLIEQQNLLLPQSCQDRDLLFKEEYCFKDLPKFEQILKIQEIRIFGTLSDIGIVNEFNITDLDTKLPTYNRVGSDLNTWLAMNSLQIQLRFCYISELNNKEQKDCCPEHLCIDVNGKKLYSYSENEETSGPFDISSYCKLGPNFVKFWLDKQNFIWELPCAYQICIVSVYTPESFLNSLKKNDLQFLHSDFTKSLIVLQQTREETAINITITDINTKTKLICPLSCRRIETPCRTTNCKHIECFDGFSFFKMNDLKYDWFCPICHTSASFDLLRIDGYFCEILSNIEKSVTEISFKSDGTYESISKNSVNENVIIELDDTMDDDDCDITVIRDDWSECITID